MVPEAKTEASIIFIVAPTETVSKKIEEPINLSAEAVILPCATVIVAPRASNPFIC